MMLMMSPPISTNATKNTTLTTTTSGSSHIISSSSNCLTNSNNNTFINSTSSQQQQEQQHQQFSSVYMIPTMPNSFSYSQAAIRKRKVKFTFQLEIQELLSVPYLNAVLFCKVRLCDGGNHVSYSSKKEVSNSSVIWSDDAPIQFDVKTVQSYVSNAMTTQPTIVGYDQCLCRISVRKEIRGGKSFQKLGYVDYNLTDFISKFNESATTQEQNEFCVNRILKEYDSSAGAVSTSSSSKKNQQRLDNSYLKIKIKILDSNLPPSQINVNSQSLLNGPPSPLSSSSSSNNTTNNNYNNNDQSQTNPSTPTSNVTTNSNQSPSLILKSINTNSPSSSNSTTTTTTTTSSANPNYTPTHSRHSSSSTTNSLLFSMNNTSSTTTNNTNSSMNNSNSNSVNNSSFSSVFVNGHYRSYSNGSIKSNLSFEFLTKNRTKKLMEELQTNTTSSSTSLTAVLNNQMNQFNEQQQLQQSTTTTSSTSSLLTPTNPSSNTTSIILNKLEPANMRIIETRVDPNEIINQIENELLASRLNSLKSNNNNNNNIINTQLNSPSQPNHDNFS